MRLKNETNLSLSKFQIFRLSWPFLSKKSLSTEDIFIQTTIAKTAIANCLQFSTLGFIVASTLYLISYYENNSYNYFWLFLNVINYLTTVIALLMLYRLKKNNSLSLLKTYIIMLLPVLGGSITWGFLPVLIDDKSSALFVLIFSATCIVIFGSNNWIVGLSWLSLLFSIIAMLPLVYTFFIIEFHSKSVIFICIMFWIACYLSAHKVAEEVIKNAFQNYHMSRQSHMIESLLDEYESHSNDFVWETDFNGVLEVNIITNESFHELKPLVGEKFINIFDPYDSNTEQLEYYMREQNDFDQLIVKFNPDYINSLDTVWELRGQIKRDNFENYIGFRGFGRNITHVQKLNELNHSKDKFETLSKFVAKIAHDFNNSLMVIQSSSEFLRSPNIIHSSLEMESILNTIEDVVNSASKVNKELLSFARKEILTEVSVNIDEIFNKISQKYKSLAPNISFIINITSNKNVFVDQLAFVRSLENLVLNSIDSMNKSGNIQLIAKNHNAHHIDMVTIRVEDEGAGFSNEALKKAVDPFFSTKRQEGGSGLGLAIVEGFVKQSGGVLNFGNLNHGAFVEMELPAINKIANSITHTIVSQHDDLKNIKMMIVDDDINVLNSLTLKFKQIISDVYKFETIVEAINYILVSDKKFDLLLTDFQFNNDDRNGVDLINTIGSKFKTVIVMTGHSNSIEELKNIDVLTKPFTTEEFFNVYKRANMRNHHVFAK